MKELSASESTFYRSRAGTAYSVANRLLELGLLEKQEGDLVQITTEGLEQLRQWVGPEVPMLDVAHSADLLRLRFFFLETLDPAQRIEFIDNALTKLQEFETRCLALIPENEKLGDYYGALATVNTILETRARIQWLQLAREMVEKPLATNSDWTATILERLNG